MEGKRVKALKKYLAKNDRVDLNLLQLIHLYQEKPAHRALNILLKKPLIALTAFKSLILLHNLLHEQAVDISLCSNVLKGMRFNAEKQFDAIISQKYINPYRLFLQRRCQIDFTEEAGSGKEKNMLIFQLINLIKAVSAFQQILYIFGRYFCEKYKFIIDFNVILAKDICKIYTTLQQRLPPPYSFVFLKEIELIHEAMYPIFFNNYFHQHLRAFKPKWISTQKPKQISTQVQTRTKKNKDSASNSTIQGTSSQIYRSFDANSVELSNSRQEQYLVRQFVIGEQADFGQFKEQAQADKETRNQLMLQKPINLSHCSN